MKNKNLKIIGLPNLFLTIILAFAFLLPAVSSAVPDMCEFWGEEPCNTPPTIVLNGDNPLNLTVGDTFTDPGATASDTENGDLTSAILSSGTVDTSVAGSYSVTYSVTDSGGLSASVTRTVVVSPIPSVNTPPTITLIGTNPLNLFVNDVFVEPGYSATDTGDGDLTASTTVSGIVDTATVGSYTLTYSVTDSGGLSTSTTRVVAVNPKDGPVLPTLTLTAAPSTVVIGATSTISWVSQNAIFCSASWTVSTSTSGDQIVSPTVTSDYVMSCGNAQGTTTATTTITVTSEPPVPVPSVTLAASPQTITVDDSSTLSWSSQNVLSCNASWTTSTSTSGTQNVSPTSTTEYSISCSGTYGNATTTTTITVNPKTVPPSDNGGGGGGGGGIGGRRHPITVQGEILGATSCMYLRDFLKIGWQNDPIEVLKLQSFLNTLEGENLLLNGIFDENTFAAVERFQIKYGSDILGPWGYATDDPTGFVYILTKKKVNEIYCNTVFPLAQSEQNEVDAFRNFSGGTAGGSFGDVQDYGLKISENPNDENTPVVELENESATTSDSLLKSAAVSLFSVPQKIFSNGRHTIIFVILAVIAVAIISMFVSSKKDDQEKELTSFMADDSEKENLEESPAKEATEEEKSSVIILPGFENEDKSKKEEKSQVFLDEEIVIENPEEGLEEETTDLSDLQDGKPKTS